MGKLSTVRSFAAECLSWQSQPGVLLPSGAGVAAGLPSAVRCRQGWAASAQTFPRMRRYLVREPPGDVGVATSVNHPYCHRLLWPRWIHTDLYRDLHVVGRVSHTSQKRRAQHASCAEVSDPSGYRIQADSSPATAWLKCGRVDLRREHLTCRRCWHLVHELLHTHNFFIVKPSMEVRGAGESSQARVQIFAPAHVCTYVAEHACGGTRMG